MRPVLLPLCLLLVPASLAAQAPRVVVAGPEYRAGEVKRFLLGTSYRDLWTTPIAVPVLDLATFAGGLTPTETAGGNQTLSLRFRGADGKEYAFRSANKDPGREQGGLPGPAKALVRDQVSSLNPAGALVAARLVDATGALHVDPLLFVMPDDPRLGEFREQFAGMLGQMEERPHAFPGAAQVEGTEEMLRALETDPAARAAAAEYLTVRLMDIVLGDWDRHGDQYQWARFDRGGLRVWRPAPRDRDYVFVDYDGLLADLGRPWIPRAVRFRPSLQESLYGLIVQAQFLDRRLLGGLERAAWDSAAAGLRARLTDALIDDAVRRMPAEYQALEGARLAATLRARRDALPAAAARYYRMMAREAEAYGTDRADLAVVDRLPDGAVEVRIHPGRETDPPYFRRRFLPDETREVRVFLLGGDDRAEVRGAGGVLVRVLGGAGDDVLEDRGTGRTAFYDHAGEDRFTRGANTVVDTRPYDRPEYLTEVQDTLRPARDWGTSGGALAPYAAVRPFADLVVGAGPAHTRYGFRRVPYAEHWYVRGLWAPLYARFGAEGRYERRWTGSGSYGYLFGRASELEAVYFSGYGNDTPEPRGLRDNILWERQALLEPGVVLAWPGGVSLGVSGVLRYTDPQVEAQTPADLFAVRGTARYLAAGARGRLAWVRADTAGFARGGWTLALEGGAFPLANESQLDQGENDEPFWRAGARATAYLPLGGAVLALRAGGEKVWGDFPVQYAAFVGGTPSLRGYAYQRFAGDASAFGSAEVRAPLFGAAGVLAFADAGRVWFGGASEGGWHTSFGGGAFAGAAGRSVSLFYAQGERGILYLRLGLPF